MKEGIDGIVHRLRNHSKDKQERLFGKGGPGLELLGG